MKIPRFDELYDFVLKAIREAGGKASSRHIDDLVVSYLKLTPNEIYQEVTEGGRSKLYSSLVTARTYLKEAGYISTGEKDIWIITEKGVKTREVRKEEILRERISSIGQVALPERLHLQKINWDIPRSIYNVSNVIFRIETSVGLDSLPPLTPTYLEASILPYFHALSNFQEIISELRGSIRRPIVIRSLRMMSPLNVSFEGAGDAIDKIREDIIPWRRKHAKQIAALEEQDKIAGIRQKEAEILEIQAKAAETEARKKEIESHAYKLREEIEQMRIKNQREKIILAREKFDLAIHIVRTIAPNTSPPEMMRHVSEIMPSLEALISSDLTPTLPNESATDKS